MRVRELSESRGLRHTALPPVRGSGLKRGLKRWEGVTGQEDKELVKTEAISQLDDLRCFHTPGALSPRFLSCLFCR